MLTTLKWLLLIFPIVPAAVGLLTKARVDKIIATILICFLIGIFGLFMGSLAHLDCADNCATGTDQSVGLLQAGVLIFDLLILSAYITRLSKNEIVLLRIFIAFVGLMLIIFAFSYSP